MAGEGEVVETTWAGRDDNGKALPDGVYSLQRRRDERRRAGALGHGDPAPRHGPAEHRERRGRSGPVQPQRGRAGDAATVTFVPSESGTARVSVVDADLTRSSGA